VTVRRLALLLTGICALAPVAPLAQSGADRAVIGVFRQSQPALHHFRIWHRVGVTGELDLVLAMGTWWKHGFDETFNAYAVWGTSETLGLFLQERDAPHRVFALAAARESCGEAHILRATATDTVISCTGEKSEIYPNQKFVYDVRAKRLVKHFSYQPFSMYAANRKSPGKRPRGAVVMGGNTTKQLLIDFEPDRVPEFRLLAGEKETPIELRELHRVAAVERPFVAPRFGPSATFSLIDADEDDFETELVVQEGVGKRIRHYRLPQSSDDAFRKARPGLVRNDLQPAKGAALDIPLIREAPDGNALGWLWMFLGALRAPPVYGFPRALSGRANERPVVVLMDVSFRVATPGGSP